MKDFSSCFCWEYFLDQLTFELFACRKSSDKSFRTIAAVGRRCINALATKFELAPPWKQSPVIICVTWSSKFSNGSLEIKLIKIRFWSSITSGCFSSISKELSKVLRTGCTKAKFSVDFRASSIAQNACDLNRQSCNEKIFKWKACKQTCLKSVLFYKVFPFTRHFNYVHNVKVSRTVNFSSTFLCCRRCNYQHMWAFFAIIKKRNFILKPV